MKLNNVNQIGGGVVGIENFPNNTFDDFDAIVYNEINAGWLFGSGFFQRTSIPGSGVKETSTDEWVHIAATYKDNDYRLYRNGILIHQTTNFLIKTFPITSRIIIGQRHTDAGAQDLDAEIDEVRVWNVARDSADIVATMNCSCAEMGAIPSTGLIACYTFNNFGDDPVADVTGNGYDLTSFGNPFYLASTAPIASCVSITSIPTMSQWGTVLLALIIVTLFAVGIYNMKMGLE